MLVSSTSCYNFNNKSNYKQTFGSVTFNLGEKYQKEVNEILPELEKMSKGLHLDIGCGCNLDGDYFSAFVEKLCSLSELILGYSKKNHHNWAFSEPIKSTDSPSIEQKLLETAKNAIENLLKKKTENKNHK